MATKLGIYSAALIEVGDRPLGSLTEKGEPRRIVDEVYASVVAECLEAGSWNFATETVKVAADTGVTPDFGYTEVFAKPTDWVMTTHISEDENFVSPLLHYFDDVNYWSANTSPLYVRYVSNDTGMGNELTRWPQRFTRYVELEISSRICKRIGGSDIDKQRIDMARDKAKRSALARDSMNEPQPKFAPAGSWTAARGGSRGRRGDRNRLIG